MKLKSILLLIRAFIKSKLRFFSSYKKTHSQLKSYLDDLNYYEKMMDNPSKLEKATARDAMIVSNLSNIGEITIRQSNHLVLKGVSEGDAQTVVLMQILKHFNYKKELDYDLIESMIRDFIKGLPKEAIDELKEE